MALLASNVSLHVIVHGHGSECCGSPSPLDPATRAYGFGCLLSIDSQRTFDCTTFSASSLMPPFILEYTMARSYARKTERLT